MQYPHKCEEPFLQQCRCLCIIFETGYRFSSLYERQEYRFPDYPLCTCKFILARYLGTLRPNYRPSLRTSDMRRPTVNSNIVDVLVRVSYKDEANWALVLHTAPQFKPLSRRLLISISSCVVTYVNKLCTYYIFMTLYSARSFAAKHSSTHVRKIDSLGIIDELLFNFLGRQFKVIAQLSSLTRN